MDFMYSFFFAGGVAAFAYTKMGRRVGYGNSQNVWTIVAIAFVVAFIFIYTLMAYVFNIH